MVTPRVVHKRNSLAIHADVLKDGPLIAERTSKSSLGVLFLTTDGAKSGLAKPLYECFLLRTLAKLIFAKKGGGKCGNGSNFQFRFTGLPAAMPQSSMLFDKKDTFI